MKVPVLSSLSILLGLASSLPAIERPKSLDQGASAPADAPRAVVEPEAIPMPEVEQAALPWLGVFGDSPDDTLRHHLDLDGGVVLRYVAEDSPAAAAGLGAHDIVTGFGGERIDSQEELRAAVMDHEPGDEVTLSVVSKGQKAEKNVVLGERPANLGLPRPLGGAGLHGRLDLEDFPELKGRFRELERLFPRDAEGELFGGDFQGQMEKMQREMEQQLQQFERLPGMELDIEELLKNLPRGEDGFNMSLKSSSSVRLMDDEGSVEMKVNDGGKEVTVRDLEGNIVYEGPWDNEQDRAAVPLEVRERIEKLNFDEQGNGIRLHFKQVPEPLELGEEAKDPQADPK